MTPWWSPFLGVIIGGLLGALLNYLTERQRWRQQRRDKLDEARREALKAALGWLDPMENALTLAEIEAYALLNGTKDEQQFRQAFPRLVSELSALDLRADQRLVLTSDPYPMGHSIRRALDDFQQNALDLWERTRYPTHSPSLSVIDAREQCSDRLIALRRQVEELRRGLGDAYKKTYE